MDVSSGLGEAFKVFPEGVSVTVVQVVAGVFPSFSFFFCDGLCCVSCESVVDVGEYWGGWVAL